MTGYRLSTAFLAVGLWWPSVVAKTALVRLAPGLFVSGLHIVLAAVNLREPTPQHQRSNTHMPPINSSTLAGWLTTSTSIIGIAVATPTFAAVLAGDLPWSAAVYPLAAAVIAVLAPQRAAPGPANPPTLAQALDELARIAVLVGRDVRSPAGDAVAAAAPEITGAFRTAVARYRDSLQRRANPADPASPPPAAHA